jgi:hypothetical protein
MKLQKTQRASASISKTWIRNDSTHSRRKVRERKKNSEASAIDDLKEAMKKIYTANKACQLTIHTRPQNTEDQERCSRK